MKKKTLLLTIMTILLGLAINAIAQNSQINSKGFYVINVAAVKTESEAKTKVTSLINEGNFASYLWIPDYASLSGAKYFLVYIGPFYSQHDCEVATQEYRKKNPSAYGLLVSPTNKRVQINGIGKVVVTDNEPKIDAKFIINNTYNDDSGNPSTNIELSFDGKLINISKVTGNAWLIDKNDFINLDIPKNALSACGAWYAGSGNYFYVIASKEGLIVYQGWQDEEQEDQGYHWKKVKEITK